VLQLQKSGAILTTCSLVKVLTPKWQSHQRFADVNCTHVYDTMPGGNLYSIIYNPAPLECCSSLRKHDILETEGTIVSQPTVYLNLTSLANKQTL
jgi:hypothetical protein